MKNAYLKKVRNEAFVEGQHYNNVQLQVRLQRIAEIKGIGPKRAAEIKEAIEAPLTKGEQEAVDDIYNEYITGPDQRRT